MNPRTLAATTAVLACLASPSTAVAVPAVSTAGDCPGITFIDVTGVTPFGSYALLKAGSTGSAALPGGPCAGTVTGLGGGLGLVNVFAAGAAGSDTLTPNLPAPPCGGTWIQVLDVATCALSNVTLLAPETGEEVFEYTGDVQFFTVPLGITSITVHALGAQGGDGGTPGGLGGSAQATIPVTEGEVLEVYVGGAGTQVTVDGAGGFNGGGDVFETCCGVLDESGTGGGASDVRRDPYTLSARLIVAGGGGGGADVDNGSVAGVGGGLEGGDGDALTPANDNVLGGGGGTQEDGGDALQCCGASYPNESGSFGTGGACWHDAAGCGGGGGGWYGGGGGSFAGGGGGSSYVDAPGNTDTFTTSGVNPGHGSITIVF